MDTNLYAPFTQLGALAVFALLMFFMNRSLVTKVLNQAAAREIAEREEGREQSKATLQSQEHTAGLLDKHLTALYTGQATLLENQRGLCQSLTDHDRREAVAWGNLLDRMDAVLVATKTARKRKKAP